MAKEDTEIITTAYLQRIEVALGIPAGHTDVSPQIRLEAILQAISTMSHRSGYVLTFYTRLLNELADFRDLFTEILDFEKDFPDDPEKYRELWEDWNRRYVTRPGRASRPPEEVK